MFNCPNAKQSRTEPLSNGNQMGVGAAASKFRVSKTSLGEYWAKLKPNQQAQDRFVSDFLKSHPDLKLVRSTLNELVRPLQQCEMDCSMELRCLLHKNGIVSFSSFFDWPAHLKYFPCDMRCSF
eukprot:c11417_g1_i3.p1 GENE.c11417_g1_i3~~c11417_g1_i3.p1  ORF type:complete len:124 (-),score=16.07 c11417_g1_i3:927-1298(-)